MPSLTFTLVYAKIKEKTIMIGEYTMAKKEKRFVKTYKQECGGLEILVDKETGVNYLYYSSGYSGGLTVLLDKGGKPVITPFQKEEQEDCE